MGSTGQGKDASMAEGTLRIGLAAARNLPGFADRLATAERFIAEAGTRGVDVVCFPEAYLPGLRGFDFPVPPRDHARQEAALTTVRQAAARHGVAVIIGMEWETTLGPHNVAVVIDRKGAVLGYQTKNQIPPPEEPHYVADRQRRLFLIDDVPVGIAICHEAWRYPETVRWAARRGAKIVFQPQLTGSDVTGPTLTTWGDPAAPYYEKAMLARAVENEIFFASVNNAFHYQESATSVLGPEGDLLGHVPYGEEQLLVCDLALARATGRYARRYDPALYPDD